MDAYLCALRCWMILTFVKWSFYSLKQEFYRGTRTRSKRYNYFYSVLVFLFLQALTGSLSLSDIKFLQISRTLQNILDSTNSAVV